MIGCKIAYNILTTENKKLKRRGVLAEIIGETEDKYIVKTIPDNNTTEIKKTSLFEIRR